jgi:hypothetical protein
MADSEYLDYRQAGKLADDLASHGGKTSLAQRVGTPERHARLASRLIRTMLRQVNSSGNWRLPDDPE